VEMKKKKKLIAKKPKVKAKAPPKDPRIEEIYEDEISFNCPVRGKVTQKVKVKRFKPLYEQAVKHVLAVKEDVDSLDKEDDGLSIYDGEELGVSPNKEDLE
jgi:hypothetical protein